MTLACCSSRDRETKIVKIDLGSGKGSVIHNFSVDFHPRALAQVHGTMLIVCVGLMDDKKSTEGIIEMFDIVKGTSVYRHSTHGRMCSIEAVKTRESLQTGSDMELFFIGTSKLDTDGLGDKKVLEYAYSNGRLIKVKDIPTQHKKSIFGIGALREDVILTVGLDGRVQQHIVNA